MDLLFITPGITSFLKQIDAFHANKPLKTSLHNHRYESMADADYQFEFYTPSG